MFFHRTPQLFQITQSAVIKNTRGAVLILQHANGKWALPGGRIQPGETWYEGLARCLKEEANIREFAVRGILEVDSWAEHGETFYSVTFECHIPEFEGVILSKEHISHAWADHSSINTYAFPSEMTKERLLRFLGPPPPPHAAS